MKYLAYRYDVADDGVNIRNIRIVRLSITDNVQTEVTIPVRINNAWIYTKVWVPKRPVSVDSFLSRLRQAWLVFRGRLDTLQWPDQD